jgi:hypothetical protein
MSWHALVTFQQWHARQVGFPVGNLHCQGSRLLAMMLRLEWLLPPAWGVRSRVLTAGRSRRGTPSYTGAGKAKRFVSRFRSLIQMRGCCRCLADMPYGCGSTQYIHMYAHSTGHRPMMDCACHAPLPVLAAGSTQYYCLLYNCRCCSTAAAAATLLQWYGLQPNPPPAVYRAASVIAASSLRPRKQPEPH